VPRFMNVSAHCLEVFCCDAGPHDGKLIGYAIQWSGLWNAYLRVPGGNLSLVGKDMVSAEAAVKAIESPRLKPPPSAPSQHPPPNTPE
jgi:hypothetical protein